MIIVPWGAGRLLLACSNFREDEGAWVYLFVGPLYVVEGYLPPKSVLSQHKFVRVSVPTQNALSPIALHHPNSKRTGRQRRGSETRKARMDLFGFLKRGTPADPTPIVHQETPAGPVIARILRPRDGVAKPVRVVCLSDTHRMHSRVSVPDGDILIHSGDFTSNGSPVDIQSFSEWLGSLPHKYKVVIAGNHDRMFEEAPAKAQALLQNCIYLQDSGIELEGLKIWGSPWQPWFCDWAFNLQRGVPLRTVWNLIPKETDILVTHGPPMGFGDKTYHGESVGCEELLKAIQVRVKPRVHIFGHIHEGYGVYGDSTTTYINASNCTVKYKPTNPPIIFDL